MNYQPVSDYLILIPIEEKIDTTIKDFVVPDSARPPLVRGRIALKGPDVSAGLKEGDEVVFSANSEYRFEIDNEPVIVIQETNIILCKPATKEDPRQKKLFPVDAQYCSLHDMRYSSESRCPACVREYESNMNKPKK